METPCGSNAGDCKENNRNTMIKLIISCFLNRIMSVFTSKAYDKLRSLIFPFGKILDEIPNKGKVLDVGCGHGTLPLYIAKNKRNVFVVGVEISNKRVLVAKEKVKCFGNVKFFNCNFIEFKGNEKFDTITCLDVLHHMSRSLHEKVIKKVSELLKPNGIFILVEIDRHPFPKYLCSRMHDLMMTKSTDFNLIRKGVAIKMLESYGFGVNSIKDASSAMYGRYMIIAKKLKRG